MNLQPMSERRWKRYQKCLHIVWQYRANMSMARAIREAQMVPQCANGIEGIMVSGDGTWMKRGYQSKPGIVFIVDFIRNKILVYHVMHKYCPRCKGRENECELGDQCQANYTGSSGGMEVEGVVKIILDLYRKFGVKVTMYLGDGDSKAFSAAKEEISKLDDNWEIIKLECVNQTNVLSFIQAQE